MSTDSQPNQDGKLDTEAVVRSGGEDAFRRRLPVFVFVATFLGSLLGLAADLSDASGLLIPILEVTDPSPGLSIAGSNTVLGEGIEVAQEWVVEFEQQTVREQTLPFFGEVRRPAGIEVQGTGSVAGFERAAQGEVDLLVASEPMPEADYEALQAAGIEIQCAGVIGYDVITFVTNVNNQLDGQVLRRDMTAVLEGTITDWTAIGGEAGPIRILARDGSGTTDLVLANLTGSGEFRSHFLTCGGNNACLDRALTVPGSLYWVSTAWLRTQPPRYLQLILIQDNALEPVENPLGENFKPDNYTQGLIRPLYMYVLRGEGIESSSTALAEQFFQYVRGVNGQFILENHHFYTHFDPPAAVEVTLPPGFGPTAAGLPIVCRE